MEEYKQLRSKSVSFESKIKSLITAINFSCVGNVSKVYKDGKRIDVTLPYLTVNNTPIEIKGVEVLRPGTHKVKVLYTPEVGDAVIVFAMQNYKQSMQYGQTPLPKSQCPYFDLYGNTTMKALLVQTNEENTEALNIDIKDDQVTIDVPSSISTVNINATKVNINDGHLTVE